jgi:2-hydroxy-6-oxonona-2,4-dienedioate hydrolase
VTSDVNHGGSMWLDLLGLEMRQHYVDAGGVRTRVLEAGTGPALLLLHGMGGHAETYQRNLGPLARHFRVIVPDMIGHGYTDRPDVPYTLDDFSDHLFDLLTALGVEKAHLSGEALGASVAAWMALRSPERTDRLVLNTGLLERPDENGLVQLADVEERTKKLATDVSLENMRRRLEWLVVDPESMSEEMVHIRHQIYSQPGMAQSVIRVTGAMLAMNRGLYEGKDYLDRELLANLVVPTQVIWSDHNPGKPYEKMKPAIDLIPGVEVHIVRDAGHWPQFEQADAVNRLMIDFLTRAGG